MDLIKNVGDVNLRLVYNDWVVLQVVIILESKVINTNASLYCIVISPPNILQYIVNLISI